MVAAQDALAHVSRPHRPSLSAGPDSHPPVAPELAAGDVLSKFPLPDSTRAFTMAGQSQAGPSPSTAAIEIRGSRTPGSRPQLNAAVILSAFGSTAWCPPAPSGQETTSVNHAGQNAEGAEEVEASLFGKFSLVSRR